MLLTRFLVPLSVSLACLPVYYWYNIKTFCVLKLILITIEMRRATLMLLPMLLLPGGLLLAVRVVALLLGPTAIHPSCPYHVHRVFPSFIIALARTDTHLCTLRRHGKKEVNRHRASLLKIIRFAATVSVPFTPTATASLPRAPAPSSFSPNDTRKVVIIGGCCHRLQHRIHALSHTHTVEGCTRRDPYRFIHSLLR